jgi:hypothetical protein
MMRVASTGDIPGGWKKKTLEAGSGGTRGVGEEGLCHRKVLEGRQDPDHMGPVDLIDV